MLVESGTNMNRLFRYGTLALAGIPILGMRTMVFVIASWFVIAIAMLLLREAKQAWNWKETLILSCPFLLMLMDSARASDWISAWKLAETSAALLIFPLGFAVIDRSATQPVRNGMMEVFSWSALALGIGANSSMLMNAEVWTSATGTAFAFSHFYRETFASVTGVHAPYAAYWIFTAALFQVHRSLQGEQITKWRMVFALVLVVFGSVIGSRMPIIAFGIALAAMLLFRFNTRKALLWTFCTVVALTLLIMALPSSRARTVEAFNTLFSKTGAEGINSVSVRSPILDCSLQLLEEHWTIGMGQPAVQPALDECYQAKGQPVLADGSYSTHNQPLHWWISFGILGLAAFALLFGYSLFTAFHQRDAIHFSFVLFILICCFTENVLARQWGMVLFACFNSLFLAAPIPRSVKVDVTAYFSETGAPRSTQ
ncbi:MAG: O-antigen ligase family protein [Flavobacteriales bacterium]|nr:O-antigen ligase family protein [Flavobacteriales bacterium]